MSNIPQLERSINNAQAELQALELKQHIKDQEINELVELAISKKSPNNSKERLNVLFSESIQDLRVKATKVQSILTLKQELLNSLIEQQDSNKIQDIWNQLKNSSFRVSPSSSSYNYSTAETSSVAISDGSGDHNSKVDEIQHGVDSLIVEAEKEITKWEIEKHDIIINREAKIGSGAFGSVYKGSVRGKEVAIKKLTQQFYDETVLNEFRKEVCLMTKLRNPHLLLFMGACTTPGDLCIVTELMPKGSVHALLRLKEDSPDYIDFKRTILIARDTALEMLHNKEYDEKTDVYSFSMLLWEMLTKLEPYNGFYKNYNELLDGVVYKQNRPTMNDNWTSKLKLLLTRCWDPLPNRRPSFDEITNHKLLDHILIEGILQDQNGRQFWTHNFIGKTEVQWNQFYQAFCSSFGVDMKLFNQENLKIKCLKLLLVEIDSDNVKIEDFGRFLGWFGPLSSGTEMLERVFQVCSLKGFLGESSSKNVVQFLANKKSGTYIVRFSSSDQGCYALSYVSKSKDIMHAKIIHKPGQGYIHMGGTTYYPSLEELIKNTGSKVLGLKDPYEGGAYYALIYASKHPSQANTYIAVAPQKKV
ncbi:SH2 domain-containing protein [Cavenderia fasciculata]|uniref:SH2 domain-containing protein n=1 Tax=Cavenderia fasciculata TaxID=261658 RepID=F4PGL9_CACFS|nr:SH2 domain-containing protein [Cavenderia fasciculata]EGG24853.1 SH2 domain-containing protein [Cavenderia fasciculata]|eukprot:XP_004362704.1 SH2 domain-containing protein [Cavenderia fasciculata]